MIYSIPYLLLLTVFALCAFFYDNIEDKRQESWINMGVIVLFYVFFAFRGYLYTDWVSYVNYFDYVEWDDLLSWDPFNSKSFEPGFALLTLVCKSIYNNYFFLVAVCTTIDTIFFVKFLKYREINNLALIFMLFCTFDGLGIMFNILRNAISIFMMMYALQYIEKRKPMHYFTFCFIGFLFHSSTLVFVPLYFFLHRKLNKWVFIGIAVFCLLFFISNISIVVSIISLLGMEGMFGGKIETYTEFITSSRSLSLLGILDTFSIAVFVFMYYDKLTEKFKNHIVIINSLLLFLIMYYMLAEFKVLSGRLATLFYYSHWVLWSDIVHIMYYKNNRILLSIILYMYCSFYITRTITRPCQEYDNLLFGTKSYQERVTIIRRTYKEDA